MYFPYVVIWFVLVITSTLSYLSYITCYHLRYAWSVTCVSLMLTLLVLYFVFYLCLSWYFRVMYLRCIVLVGIVLLMLHMLVTCVILGLLLAFHSYLLYLCWISYGTCVCLDIFLRVTYVVLYLWGRKYLWIYPWVLVFSNVSRLKNTSTTLSPLWWLKVVRQCSHS